jgi:hypothetical protein
VHVKKWFETVEINFMIVGHTKFSVDRHFGEVKREIKELNEIESIKTVYDVIEQNPHNKLVKVSE